MNSLDSQTPSSISSYSDYVIDYQIKEAPANVANILALLPADHPFSEAVSRVVQEKLKNNLLESVGNHKKQPIFYEEDFNEDVRWHNDQHYKAFIAEPPLVNDHSLFPLKVETFSVNSQQGTQAKQLQDTYHIEAISLADRKYFMAAIFDGHHGKEVAQFAKEEIIHILTLTLDKTNQVYFALLATIQELQQRIAAKPEFNSIGSTAVICLIDQTSNLLYTATLGDSEANLYRSINGVVKSIPLSVIKDFGDRQEFNRGKQNGNLYYKDVDGFRQDLVSLPRYLLNPQGIYFVPKGGTKSQNVSRSLGDVSYGEGISHEPLITVTKLQKDDLLLLACDGLKTVMPEDVLIDNIQQNEQLGQILIEKAVKTYRACDDITIVALKILQES